MDMKSHLWFAYSLICTCMMVYLCWQMGVMTSLPRYQMFCQQFIKEVEREGVTTQHLSRVSKNIAQQNKTLIQNYTSNTVLQPTYVEGEDINPKIAIFFTIKKNEKKDMFINQHKYNFTINSQVCRMDNLFLIMVIHSAPAYRHKRDRIRNAYGSVKSYMDLKIGYVFMLGANGNYSNQISIEAAKFGDIVQGNFQDSYKSLNRKHIMAMHWFTHQCSADFIMKLDDDTFVNPYRVVDYILLKLPIGMSIHCYVINQGLPQRKKSSKWHTPVSQYPFSKFPQFCLGFAYLTTPKAWKALYRASETLHPMDMDDVYVSGVLAMKAGVGRVNMTNEITACPNNVSAISLKELKTKAVLLDRRNKCGFYAFGKWKRVEKTA